MDNFKIPRDNWPIKPTEHNDKDGWCKYGEDIEVIFVEEVAHNVGVMDCVMNPEKKHNKYAHDVFVGDYRGDLKYCGMPFYRSQQKWKMNPKCVVTFDNIDYVRYMKQYPGLKVIFWCDWQDSKNFGVVVEATQAVWVISMKVIDHMIKDGQAGRHVHNSRVDCKKGNAKWNHVLDLSQIEPVWRTA